MTVFLVGAGPGDPGLLTRRGAEVLAEADVVVHDRLSAPELLDLAPAEAERIDVGKTPGSHRLAQDEINALLVERGRSGENVVRLKGGDPFVFARGSEEAHALMDADVDFEVVPGITSALAVPAYAGIPVTQRFSSTSFTVVTGHEDPSAGDGSVNWEAIAATGGTLVVLMGVSRWSAIAERLLAAGRAPDTPAAAIRWGTRPEQVTVRATLATLGDHELEAPSVIVVGSVAAERLEWFTDRPLFGRRVVVTRSRDQASVVSAELMDLGAEVIEAPMIETVRATDEGAGITAALAEISRFDWLVFTSPRGVDATLGRVADVRALGNVKIAVVGDATAAALRRHRLEPALIPDRFFAEALLESFPEPSGEEGRDVLLAVAEDARPVLQDGLRAAGWNVTVAHPYRSAPVAVDDATATAVREADAVLFASSGTVRNLIAAVGVDGIPETVVSIGPITSGAVVDNGLTVTAEADPHTIDGLIRALIQALG